MISALLMAAAACAVDARAAGVDAAFFAALQRGGQAILLGDGRLPPPPAAPGRPIDEVKDAVARLLAGSGVPASFVDAAFNDPRREFIAAVPPQVRKPSESLPYDDYRKIFITEPRIAAGAAFFEAQQTTLSAVSARYDVDPLLLTALVGVETFYGRGTGRYVVFNALGTIAASVPARVAFAERELAELLKLCWSDGRDVYSIKGSYAGAFGYGQFLPSTFNRYAVDFDGDGKKSFDQWPDALATAANYLQASGYAAGSADFSRGSRNWRAIYAYNHHDNYVRVVIELRQAVSDRLRQPAKRLSP